MRLFAIQVCHKSNIFCLNHKTMSQLKHLFHVKISLTVPHLLPAVFVNITGISYLCIMRKCQDA